MIVRGLVILFIIAAMAAIPLIGLAWWMTRDYDKATRNRCLLAVGIFPAAAVTLLGIGVFLYDLWTSAFGNLQSVEAIGYAIIWLPLFAMAWGRIRWVGRAADAP